MAKKQLLKAGVKKLAGFGKKTKPYAKFKSKQAELAKRKAKIMGEPMPTKKPSTKASYIEGAITGSAATAATYTYLKSKKAKEAKAKETKAKLKKSIEKKREEDKKKKEKHHSR